MPLRYLAVLLLLFPAIVHATTRTAASSAESDVAATIALSSNGDTVQIPCSPSSVVWTTTLIITPSITISGLGATPNTTPSTFGSGTNCLTIRDDNTSGPLFSYRPVFATTNNLVVLQNMNIDPFTATTTLSSPVEVGASNSCTSSGCPNFRIDNIIFGNSVLWNGGTTGGQASWMIRTDNVFGVIDHCTLPNGSNVQFYNPNHSAYLGVGAFGDNSWAQPDSFGGANNTFAENNLVYIGNNWNFSDCEIAPAAGGVGGCRQVDRFNEVFSNNGVGIFGNHGLETDGRPQGGRQLEVYGNNITCTNSSCNIIAGFRSGTGFVFGNQTTENSGAWFNQFAFIAVYRTVFTASYWGACGGSSPYDVNDGVVYYSGTNTGGSGLTTLTDNSKSWTTNQFIPSGAPYSVYDTTQNWWAEIASNTAHTLTIQGSIPEQNNVFHNGDSYQILRATVCADQGGRGQGNYVSGTPPSPAASLAQALDPIYEWDDTANLLSLGNVQADTGRVIDGRDFFSDESGGTPHAQTSSTSPFNGGNVGVGFGTLARRPTSCTAGVGYFATDQGSWNQSGNSFGQGVLYKCGPSNTWTTYYQPYTYPHPLISGGGGTPGPPVNFTGSLKVSGGTLTQ